MPKTYTDDNGYKRGKLPHSDLIHRQKAYRSIYLKNRNEYPLPFSQYVVHHRDGNKKNNRISNLQILTPAEHNAIHGIHHHQVTLKTETFEGKFNDEKLGDSGGEVWKYPYDEPYVKVDGKLVPKSEIGSAFVQSNASEYSGLKAFLIIMTLLFVFVIIYSIIKGI